MNNSTCLTRLLWGLNGIYDFKHVSFDVLIHHKFSINSSSYYFCKAIYINHYTRRDLRHSLYPIILTIKKTWDFPGGPVARNLPANTEDMGLIPGPGRFHMHGATKLVCPTTEPMCYNYRSLHTLGPQPETCALQLGSSPRSPQLEKTQVHQRPSTAINK